MKSRHRRHDSLDLLLDTVCNAFGGLILIALLVALLVQSSHLSEVDDTDKGTSTVTQQISAAAVERNRLERRLENLQQQVHPEAEQMRREHERDRQAALAARERLIVLRNSLTAQADSLIDGVDRLSGNLNSQLALSQQEVADLEAAIVRLREELSSLQERQIHIQAAIDQEAEERTIRVRLPRQRGVMPNATTIILRHGLIYPRQPGHSHRLESTELNATDVLVEAIPGAGLKLTDDREAIKRALRGHQGIDAIVYADSFHLYREFRELASELSLAWAWDPFTDDAPLIFTSGPGHRPETQQ